MSCWGLCEVCVCKSVCQQICCPMGPQWNLTPAPTGKDKAICPPHTPIPPRGYTLSGAIWRGFADSVWSAFIQPAACRMLILSVCLLLYCPLSRWKSLAEENIFNPRHEWQDTSWSASSLSWGNRRGWHSSVGPFKLKWLKSNISLKERVTQRIPALKGWAKCQKAGIKNATK